MKAAVMYVNGGLPRYEDYPEPMPANDEEIIVRVKAAALKHFDKGQASGAHYSSKSADKNGQVIGGDGVCLLDDGARVYGMAVRGMMAEKAVIYKSRTVLLPEGLSDTDAAVLGNAVIGSAMGLLFKARIKPGDVVLVNGATGFTGRVAVQLARHYGASRVIATGRNPKSLRELLLLGANEIISLQQTDEEILSKFKIVFSGSPVDIVIDYLWGHSAELILAGLKGKGDFTNEIRYVSVGSMAGDSLALSAASLRSVNLQISGSGLGSWSRGAVNQLFKEILPEMFQLAAEGKLQVKTTSVKLKDIAGLWDLVVPDGQRLVIIV